MLNVSKSLRKLGIVSVSALMLLGVGAGVTSANQNANAESKADADAKAEVEADISMYGNKNGVPKDTIRDEKQDAQEAVDYAKKHPSQARSAMTSIADGERDINIKPYERALRPIANKYDAHHVDDTASESQDKNNPKSWYRNAKVPSSYRHKAAKKHAHKHVSKRKRAALKKGHKSVSRRELKKQIKALRTRISKANRRKHHSRRAKRYINKLSHQLDKLNRQLKKK